MIGGAGAALLSGTPLLSRAAFLAGLSDVLGANQRILYVPNGTDTTSSVESSTVGRTITWDGNISGRRTALGNGYVQSFNGSSQYGEVPDANDLSFGNGTTDSAFSVVGLVNPSAITGEHTILAKFATVGGYEWRCVIDSGGLVRMYLWDQSAGVAAQARTLGAISAGQWACLSYTYTAATGGATAANDMYTYVNGVDRTSVRVNNASYVAMENGTALGSIGVWEAHTFAWLPGSLGLVALTQKALTAADHQRVAALCARHFGLTL